MHKLPFIVFYCFILTVLGQLDTAQLLESDLSPDDVTSFGFADASQAPASVNCKTFPTDAAWPSEALWDRLNTLTHGALIKTVPIGAPCYPGPLANAERCTAIAAQWTNSSLHTEDPTSIMSPYWQGRTCLPPSIYPSATNSCTLGGYPSYALNASTVAQIQLAVNFARNHRIRLVVKNTGHDFSGKSAGAGALSIWTHGLKEIRYLEDYEQDGGGYRGKAFEAGSGVQAEDIYEAAAREGQIVVGGEGKTVGVMGGYIQGGGHSPLSSLYGIAADHVLSISLILPSGQFTTASPTKNPSLFFALRGGGGSTYGIVTSLIVKSYPNIPVTSTAFAITGWPAIRAYWNYFIPHSEAGIYAYFFVLPGPAPTLAFQSFFAPNLTTSQTAALLAPFLADLAALNISVAPVYKTYPTFLSAWEASFPQEAVGGDAGFTGSRLFPRSSWTNSTSLDATFAAWRSSVDAGLTTINFNFAPRFAGPGPDTTAVLPAWRETVLHSIQVGGFASGASVAEIRAGRKLFSEQQAAWKAVSPDAGAYLGESDREEVDFQKSFYGRNYERLLAVKREVDPWDLLWAKTAVGSERWAVRTDDVLDDENGVLCRV